MKVKLSLLTMLLVLPLSAAAIKLPPNDGYVTDTTNIVSVTEQERLELILTAHEKQFNSRLLVLVVDRLLGEPIDTAASVVRQAWNSSETDGTIIFLISYTDRSAILSVDSVLTEYLDEPTTSHIIEHIVQPFFRSGQYAAGIEAGIVAVQRALQGEYSSTGPVEPTSSIITLFLWYVLAMILTTVIIEMIAITLRPERRWWLGSLVGFFYGISFLMKTGHWLSITLLIIFGFVFDLVLFQGYHLDSRLAHNIVRQRRRQNRYRH